LGEKNPLAVYGLGVLLEQQRKFQETSVLPEVIEVKPKFECGYFFNLRRCMQTANAFTPTQPR